MFFIQWNFISFFIVYIKFELCMCVIEILIFFIWMEFHLWIIKKIETIWKFELMQKKMQREKKRCFDGYGKIVGWKMSLCPSA